MSHTIFTFPLFFDLILVLLFWLALNFVMPQHLSCFPYSITYNLCHSILHPLSLVHLLSSATLSLHPPLFPSSILHHPLITSFCIPVSQLLASLFCSILIFPTSIHYSLPPCSNFVYLTFHPLWLYDSFSAFSILPHSLYFSKPCSL